MPVARVTLERTLVRGSQCPNNPSAHRNQQYQSQTPSFVDLSQSNHRNERLKQKYDHNGQSMFTYGKKKRIRRCIHILTIELF